MKRLIASLLFVFSLCIALLGAAAYAEDSDFQINKSGVLTKYTGPGGDVVIPDGVTAIGEKAFKDCENLTSVVIPDGVTSIGMWAFYNCTNLTNVNIPDSITSIGLWAFRDCEAMTDVYINDLKAYLEIDYMDSDSIPTYYAPNLYLNGELLKGDIAIPDGVNKIPAHAFRRNKNITDIKIPDSVITIENGAFFDCTGLTNVTIGNGVTDIGDVWNYPPSYRPGDRPAKSDGAFSGCTNLTSIIIPNSVKSIGDVSFSGCTGLTNITIPDSVKTIGDYAFENCDNLTNVYINDLKAYLEIAHVYYINAGYTVPTYYAPNLYLNGKLITGDVIIPDGTSIISDYAFYKNKNITSVTIPDSVMSIGHYAFSGCSNLASIAIGNGVTDIGNLPLVSMPDSRKAHGDGAFSDCTNLTTVTIGNNVTTIGCEVFKNCRSLTGIIIPNNVTAFGDSAFRGCSSLISITIPDSVTSIRSFAFYGCSSLTSIDVAGGNEKYCSIDGNLYNKAQTELIQYAVGKKDIAFSIPQGVITIGSDAVWNCNNLTSVTIPDSVTSIGSYAFAYCHNLTTISFMGNAPEFDGSAIPDSSTLTAYYPVGKKESYAAAMKQFPNVKWRVQGGGCEHNWGAWKITKNPTQTENGLAERICTFDSSHKETVILPALTDASVWTKGAYAAPTCGKEGSQEYTSIYGAVTETLSVTEHSWGAWRITQNPTQTETGKAERSCGNDSSHKDIKELPALTDSTVWTKGAYVAPTNDKNGSQEYTSIYGAVIEAIPALGHKFTVLQHDETKHWYKCEDCDATFNEENHRGGQATKKEKAICSVCNAQYGKLLPDYALPADLKTTYGKALSDITLPTGWKWSDPSIVPTVTNNGYEAYYAIENDADYDWTNENGYDAAAKQIKLTLTVTVEKEKQKLSFEKSSINKYTTDSAFTNELTKTAVFGAVSFSSSDESVATVDNNGLITIKGTGTTDITASAAETETHSAASATFTLKVSKKDSGGGGGGGGGSRGSSISVAPGGAKKDDTQSSNQTEQTGSGSPFSDVQKSDWFYEPMKFVYSNGLMKGVSDNEFDPNGAVSRAMLVTVLYRMEKEPQAQASPFSDIAGGSYYEKAVAWANANGIVKGVSDAEFAPDESITREQMAAMIYRYAAYKKMDLSAGESTNILSYADYSDISDYAVSAMRYAAGSGIINGMTADTLSPKGISTRAQAAAVFMRVFNLFNK